MNSPRLESLLAWGRVLIIVLVVFVAALAVNTMKAVWQPSYPVNQISITGEGEVFAIPDVAEFSVSVVEEAKTVEDAQSQSAEKIRAIIEYLKNQGIEEKDIKTEYYNVYPKYEYQRGVRPQGEVYYYPPEPTNQVLVGYEVNQTLSVKVRDVEKAGALISGAGELGATNISSISFTVDDEEKVKDEARALAIADARDKAEELSESLGVRLGRVVSFYEEGGYPLYYEGYGGGFDKAVSVSEAVPPELPVGENKTTIRITVTYEIR